jgi:hypothetical protein
MLSRWLAKVTGVVVLCLAVSTAASAQYGGAGSGGSGGSGGTGSTSPGTSNGYSSGSGKAIGIGVGVAAAAAVGIALLVHHHHTAAHSQASLTGCTQSVLNGISLKNESDNQTYMILSNGARLEPGERVELEGVVTSAGSETKAFRVRTLVNNYGACGSTAAALETTTKEKDEVAVASK